MQKDVIGAASWVRKMSSASNVKIDIWYLCRLARLDDVHGNVRKSTKLPIAAGPGQGKNVTVGC